GKKGLNSGFMLWQYTAASLVSENKVLSHPASVDSIPTSGNLEDHVSMGMNSVLKLKRILRNTEKVVAIELMLAVRALEFRRPLKSSEKIENLYRKVRENVPSFDEDRCFQDDFAKILGMIEKGRKLYEEV
ncbi:MAG: histidine ammonia-lyase, partial [Thermotoga sp.]